MTNDIEGNLFIAVYGANKVLKIDPKYVKNSSASDISIRLNLMNDSYVLCQSWKSFG